MAAIRRPPSRMNQNKTLETANDHSENSLSSASVDDFIRELEHLEQDLHITSELEIEVSESEFDDKNIPDFVLEEIKTGKSEQKAVEPPSSPAAHEKLRREIAQLENVISKFKAERKEIIEHLHRQAKDFENFKNRTERERNDKLSIQMENLAAQMLPVLDNLNRAMDFAQSMSAGQRAGIEPFIDGITLVHHQVDDVLATMGVRPIASVGSEFDPYFHEAVAIETSVDLEPNTVSEEFLKGYQMGSRVLRHSMVKVTAPNQSEPKRPLGDLNSEDE
jgi:molecular chaperone GrpE